MHVRNAIARFNQVEGVSDDERDEAWPSALSGPRDLLRDSADATSVTLDASGPAIVPALVAEADGRPASSDLARRGRHADARHGAAHRRA